MHIPAPAEGSKDHWSAVGQRQLSSPDATPHGEVSQMPAASAGDPEIGQRQMSPSSKALIDSAVYRCACQPVLSKARRPIKKSARIVRSIIWWVRCTLSSKRRIYARRSLHAVHFTACCSRLHFFRMLIVKLSSSVPKYLWQKSVTPRVYGSFHHEDNVIILVYDYHLQSLGIMSFCDDVVTQ